MAVRPVAGRRALPERPRLLNCGDAGGDGGSELALVRADAAASWTASLLHLGVLAIQGGEGVRLRRAHRPRGSQPGGHGASARTQ